MQTSNPSPTSIHERHSVTRNRIEFSCSSVKGTRIPPLTRYLDKAWFGARGDLAGELELHSVPWMLRAR